MKIKTLKVASLFSFGHEQVFEEFKTFNLFIGKNGTGKTAILNILNGLPVSFMRDPHRHGTFIPALTEISNTYQNRSSILSDLPKKLEIEYEVISGKNTYLERIILGDKKWDGAPQFTSFHYVDGNLSMFNSSNRLIKLPKNELEFFKDIKSFGLGSSSSINKIPLLNFGLYYIFDTDYIFFDKGVFIKGHPTSENKIQSDDIEKLPSGVFHCAQLLVKYFLVNQQVILIDEPELHFEPRIIRKFLHFIIWHNVRFNKNRTEEENKIFEVVDKVRLDNYGSHTTGERVSRWFILNKNAIGNHSKIIDIPEEPLHPANIQNQIFIASHSPILINEFLRLSDSSTIYKFENELKIYKAANNMDSDEFHQKKDLFSTVKRIEGNSDASLLLDSLGVKGSDILQTNGVIWVEGPSDVIYLKKWLEMYASENNKTTFIQGRDYEFQMFGGALLDSLCLIHEGENEEESYKKIVSMFSFSRNAFVVIDSDAEKKPDGTIVDISKFIAAKQYIKKQFELLSEDKANLGLWFKDGSTEIRTIENYLDADSADYKKPSWTKKIAAQKVTESWDSSKKLIDFPNDLKSEIEILYQTIEEWNK